jgi:Na+-transporting methylmalonyl-CoA/oxaloacetate decarboxylase gamma subunit
VERCEVGDIIFLGIAFVFIGLCLLYVRAVDKL